MYKMRGFTLVEVLVVVALITIFSAVIYANFSQGSAQSRDAKRKADLEILAGAIERYMLKNGRYPEGCNAATTDWILANSPWSGQLGTSHACTDGSSQYIRGLAPEFISVLPKDPRLNGANSGYVYATNAEGSAYKIMALNTVETETVTPAHPFARCGQVSPSGTSTQTWLDTPRCARSRDVDILTGSIHVRDNTDMPQCHISVEIQNDYAVFGGYAAPSSGAVNAAQQEASVEYKSEIVVCK